MANNFIKWLIKKSNNNLDREDTVWGLVGGLVWGLVWGLVGGLVWGLVVGLVVGLVWGLVWGLVGGLVGGLVVGLVWGLVGGLGSLMSINIISFFRGDINLLAFFIILFLLAEIYFWLFDKAKIKKNQNTFKFTLKRKLIALIYSFLLWTQILGAIANYNLLKSALIKHFPEILKWGGYVGLGLLALGVIILIFYLWIKLNERKYK